jgi:hypothetical protein
LDARLAVFKTVCGLWNSQLTLGFDKGVIFALQTQFVNRRGCLRTMVCGAEGYSDESFQPRCFQRNKPLRPRRFMCISWKRSYFMAAWLVDLR